jgi:8-oxo-dGTP pyrophosphatase MutT (NUDIX family)
MEPIGHDVDTALRSRQLQRWLEAHSCADRRERRHRERMLELLDDNASTHERPFVRDFFEPGHFTASAFVLSHDRSQLLLIFHSKLTRWLQPGGHVDDGDLSIEETARREVSEEVGLSDLALARSGIFDLDIHLIPARKTEPAHEHFDVRFAFVADSTTFKAGDDALDARWFPLATLTEGASDRSVSRAVEKLGS